MTRFGQASCGRQYMVHHLKNQPDYWLYSSAPNYMGGKGLLEVSTVEPHQPGTAFELVNGLQLFALSQKCRLQLAGAVLVLVFIRKVLGQLGRRGYSILNKKCLLK